jgi:hypothetical protein
MKKGNSLNSEAGRKKLDGLQQLSESKPNTRAVIVIFSFHRA